MRPAVEGRKTRVESQDKVVEERQHSCQILLRYRLHGVLLVLLLFGFGLA